MAVLKIVILETTVRSAHPPATFDLFLGCGVEVATATRAHEKMLL
jgi:hypothetical protein